MIYLNGLFVRIQSPDTNRPIYFTFSSTPDQTKVESFSNFEDKLSSKSLIFKIIRIRNYLTNLFVRGIMDDLMRISEGK